jgi:hypothetical protein
VGHGNFFYAFRRLGAGGDVVHGVKNFSTVIPQATFITDANYDSFENDEALLVLERLSRNVLRPDSAVAVFTRIPVSSVFSGIC